MCTLDTNYLKKQTIAYLLISMFCFVFGRVYETYSHDVYSSFMMNAYIIPLVLGLGISFILYKTNMHKIVNRISINLYNASIATFTIYSILRGVLEIYGTTNGLIDIYLYVGLILVLASIFICFVNYIKQRIVV